MKTTILGVLTIISAVVSGAIQFLGNGSVDLLTVVPAISAGYRSDQGTRPTLMSHEVKGVDSFTGIMATSLGLITSLQEQVEFSLRIISLIIGISVGLFSLYRILKKP
jgi:hypothetical protein